MSLATTFGWSCRTTRIRLDLTQQALGDAVGVSRSYIARIERGQVNVSLDLVERIGGALGLQLDLVLRPPSFLSERLSHDRVHAWCVEAVGRRLSVDGWRVAREVDVSDGPFHAWIDLLAFHPGAETLLILEVKTRLDDLGGLQRQIGWYERFGQRAAARLGWRPRRSATWLICLASEEIDRALVANRSVMDRDFAGRAGHMLEVVGSRTRPTSRGLALIDPRSHRRDWLIRTRLDGRRSKPPYDGYAAAAAALPSPRR